VTLNGTPANYEFWLAETIKNTTKDSLGKDSLVFINAWNEWAEGCHLEPDRAYGHGFLEATERAISGKSTLVDFQDIALPSVLENPERRFFHDLYVVFIYHISAFVGNCKLRINRYPRLKKLLLPIVNMARSVAGR
jgi:Glycosyltransferase WbsX